MRGVLLALGGTMIVVACRSSPPAPVTSATSLSSAPVVVSEDAVLRIAGATCAREVGCANIGAGKRFADAAECTVATGRSAEAEIGESICPSGVNDGSLAQCLSDLRNLVCSIRIATPAQLVTCRRGVLCGVDVRR